MNSKDDHFHEGKNENVMWRKVAAFLQDQVGSQTTGEQVIFETHISLVVIIADDVYKLKKPLKFDFLDYSSRQRRRLACEREVELNRRLAAKVYRGVVPVTMGDDGKLAINGQGDALEWMAWMRRLPADRMMDQLILNKSVTLDQLERLAGCLARFYETADKVCLSQDEYRKRFRIQISANRSELLKPVHGLDTMAVRRFHCRQLQFLAFEADTLERRVSGGCIVDGHGDLRPEHVCLEDEPKIIDCIEFNDQLRQVDVVDELAFLAMECERLGDKAVADALFSEFERSGCYDAPVSLVEFYKSYRAAVRAKVAALRSEQLSAKEASSLRHLVSRYIEVADRRLGDSSKTFCIIMRGLSGTGKSSVARPLSDVLGWELLQTDKIRQEIFGVQPEITAYAEGRYSPQNRLKVYESMLERAADYLISGVSVVLDGSFIARDLVERAVLMAKNTGALPVIVHCYCNEVEVQARFAERQRDGSNLSDARFEHYLRQKREDVGSPREDIAMQFLDTSEAEPAEQAARVVSHLGCIVHGEHRARHDAASAHL